MAPSDVMAPIPVIAPAVEISQSSELMEINCPLVPPPKVMSPVEVPVATLTSKLEETLRATAAPVTVKPAVVVMSPLLVIAPIPVIAPVASMSQSEELMAMVPVLVPRVKAVVPSMV